MRLQNQLESFLEEAHLKLSSLVSDLLGQSGRRRLHAIAEGETKPEVLAATADRGLKATQAQLCDALGAATHLNPVYRQMPKMTLEHWQILEDHIDQLDKQVAGLLEKHQDAVQRLAEIPGLGPDSAQQIIAEIGPTAAPFASEKELAGTPAFGIHYRISMPATRVKLGRGFQPCQAAPETVRTPAP